MPLILTEWGEFTVADRGGTTVSAEDAERVTGWTAKPEGMCRDDVCVPLGAAARDDGTIDLAAFWRVLGRPVVSDRNNEIWVLGTAAEQRGQALSGLEAPDFTLPDLEGVPHRLSDLRGTKVFLTTWASW